MVRTFNFNKISLIIGGVVITGFADGDAISLEANEDRFTFTEGAAGDGEYTETNKRAETLTIQLQRTSASNSYLNELYKSGELFDVQCMDHNDNSESWGSSDCRIMRRANFLAGSDSTPREWVINLPKVE